MGPVLVVFGPSTTNKFPEKINLSPRLTATPAWPTAILNLYMCALLSINQNNVPHSFSRNPPLPGTAFTPSNLIWTVSVSVTLFSPSLPPSQSYTTTLIYH